MKKKLTRKEEETLLHECINGNGGEKLVQQYERMICHIIVKILKRFREPYSRQDIEDLRNEVFFRLFKDECALLRLYRGDRSSLARWIGLITAQTVSMYLRKRDRIGVLGKNRPVSLEEMNKELASEQNITEDIEEKDAWFLIRKCMEKMSHAESLLLKLRFFDGLSWDEVAASLRRKKNNIYQIKHRAVRKLKECIKKLFS
ncbi:RNA polymerase sigma factor [Desulfonema magnum]|uniref:RNA polymerase sigma factor sigma-70 domain-containing protein n=1 Tax=Desulfonema magnum TaxID=45655 RepID=A0A975BS70_9BACT|nr:sigma-70 family RNA polymerase sigma factor [Desulfonema magnum]QTA90859.1 RNA polymerase sigma factor sigma-70 domain-containing protein [Desulfonema magnum]